MLDAAREGFLEATDVADYLVEKGVPFREAHAIVGKIVLYCAKNGKRLPELTLKEYRGFSPRFSNDMVHILAAESIVRRRDNLGGTARRRVLVALRKARRSCLRG